MIQQEYPDFQRLDDAKNDTSKAWKVPGFKVKYLFFCLLYAYNSLELLFTGPRVLTFQQRFAFIFDGKIFFFFFKLMNSKKLRFSKSTILKNFLQKFQGLDLGFSRID